MIKNINFYNSKKIKNSKISFGFFNKNYGNSTVNYSSLNFRHNYGDTIDSVNKNIEIALNSINLKSKKLKIIKQIHSNKVILINNKNLNDSFEADGMISQNKNIAIAVLTADCCPIFFFDDEGSFISCIHAGWKGCYNNIVENALNKINKIQPISAKINAIIGPCLGKKNFEVSEDFKDRFISRSNSYKEFFVQIDSNKKIYFNMRALLKSQIINNNVSIIDDINLDTYSNSSLFFSHRRSFHSNSLPTGRMINIIGFSS